MIPPIPAALVVKVAVHEDSADAMWFAYGTTDFPTALSITA